jgi:hypothetical protein
MHCDWLFTLGEGLVEAHDPVYLIVGYNTQASQVAFTTLPPDPNTKKRF